jgi:hypothetical protein
MRVSILRLAPSARALSISVLVGASIGLGGPEALGRGFGRRPDGADFPQVGQLRVDDGVHLLGEILLARGAGPLDDVVDRLRTADDQKICRLTQ